MNETENQPLPKIEGASENEMSAPVEMPSAEAPKRRRGRPPKNPQLGAENPGGTASAATGPKKRAGQKMSGEKINSLAKQLQGIHALAAMVTNLPECAISDGEAAMLADSVANVAAQYDLSIDGKTGAFIQLAGAAALIYGPRYLAIRARMNRPAQGFVSEVKPNEFTAN